MTDLRIAPPPPAHGDTPPQDIAAEQALIGAILLSRTALQDTAHLNPADFWRPAHETIWIAAHNLHARGEAVDAITVADELTRTGHLDRTGGTTYLHHCINDLPTAANAAHYADIVADKAALRRITEAGHHLTSLGLHPGDTTPQAALHAARGLLDDLAAHHGTPTDIGLDVDTFLAADDDEYDWLIPGFLERQDRLLLTAGEGVGKSTMLRQWAVQTAAGIHPFTGEHGTPQRVLLLDLENSERQTRRKLRPLRIQAGRQLDPGNLIVVCKGDGLDLTDDTDRTWLQRLLTHHQPDLLVTGPVYKLAGGDPNAEEDAKPAAMFLDRLRVETGVSLIIEAHSAKASGGGKRPKEPFGWSGWMRWPEFGLHLSEDGDLTHWRGMRDERDIPTHFNRGGIWPWAPVMNLAEQRWIAIKNAIQNAPKKLSERQLADITKIPQTTVHRILAEHAGAVLALNHRHELEG